jgi:hypothetical protein
LATTYLAFFEKYRKARAEEKHFYEVIPEGHACKLYFDIEFNRDLNPSCDGDHLIDILIEAVSQELVRVFHIGKCTKNDVLDLDSSTDKKFSRHLIFNLKDAVFADNLQAGNFVAYLSDQLKQEICSADPSSKIRQLIVKSPHTTEDLFIDLGVYSRNRNFRILWSSKLGKSAHLCLVKASQFKTHYLMKHRDLWKNEQYKCLRRNELFTLFLSSLVCSVRFDGSQHPRILTFDFVSKPLPGVSARAAYRKSEAPCVIEKLSHSPFDQLDSFVLSQVTTGGVNGIITKTAYFPEGNMLTYDIGKNRWCWNIGRQHKSNHIMIVIDLKQGVFYQKCHDPECQKINYKSSDFPIPVEINPLQQLQVAAGCFDMEFEGDALCDEELVRATDQCLAVVPSEELCNWDSFEFDDITDSQLLDACEFDPDDMEDLEPT